MSRTCEAESMAEVADSSEDHGKAEAVGSGDHIVIFHGSAGLDHGRGSCSRDRFEPVREREEGVGGSDGAFKGEHGFLCAEAGGVYAAHLDGTDAEGLSVTRGNCGGRFDVLADAPGKDETAEFFGGRR